MAMRQYKAGQWGKFGGFVPSGNAHKVWVDRVDVLRPAARAATPAPCQLSPPGYI